MVRTSGVKTPPNVLSFLSWLYFPSFSNWIIEHIFGYYSTALQKNFLWNIIIRFFYSWYTFIAIGLAGMWAVAAFLSRKKQFNVKQSFYPMVSFIVPAFNQDKNILGCINRLFKSAAKYQGSAEIIVIDDGSSDFTYEIAWSAINKNHLIYPRILGKVIRHSSNLGKKNAQKRYDTLDEYNLTQFFSAIILSGEHGIHKPDPRIFSIALEKLSIQNPEEVYHIGDSYWFDVQAARKLGIVGVLLDTNKGSEYDCDIIGATHEEINSIKRS